MTYPSYTAKRRQRGAALIVSLIMLTVATAVGVSNFNLGRGGLQIVANSELDLETFAATQGAIEQVLNSSQVFRGIPAFFCQGVANRSCVATRDGQIVVNLDPPPQCVRIDPIMNDELDLTDQADQGCAIGTVQQGAVEGTTTGANSMCSDVVWEISAEGVYLVGATSVDGESGTSSAQVSLRQGVSIRSSNTNAETLCP